MFQSRKILRNQAQLIEEMRQTNQLLQALPAQLARKSGTLSVENLNIQQATLDKLLFQLDRIDVKELSGTLNLGNNFHSPSESRETEPNMEFSSKLQKIIQSSHQTPKAEEPTASQQDSDESSDIHEEHRYALSDQVQSTVSGYTVRVSQS